MDTPIVMQAADDYYPTDYWSSYLTHGIMSWVFALWMFILMAAWSAQLSDFSAIITLFSWIWPSINFAAMLPVAVLFIMSSPHADSKKLNGWFYGFIVASNIYTWFLTFINIIWLFIMWLWAAVLHDFVAGEEKPSTAFAWIGMLLATTIQILYTWSSKRSMKMVRCWWKGGLETGGEYCSRFADY